MSAEIWPYIPTLYFQFLIHDSTLSLTPLIFNVLGSLLWETSIPTRSCLFTLWLTCSKNSSILERHDIPLEKPCWFVDKELEHMVCALPPSPFPSIEELAALSRRWSHSRTVERKNSNSWLFSAVSSASLKSPHVHCSCYSEDCCMAGNMKWLTVSQTRDRCEDSDGMDVCSTAIPTAMSAVEVWTNA